MSCAGSLALVWSALLHWAACLAPLFHTFSNERTVAITAVFQYRKCCGGSLPVPTVHRDHSVARNLQLGGWQGAGFDQFGLGNVTGGPFVRLTHVHDDEPFPILEPLAKLAHGEQR